MFNLRYAILLTLLGVAQIVQMLRLGEPWRALMAWSALSWLAVGLGYWGLGPHVFGKRADGRLRALNICLLLPYLIFAWGIWRLRGLLTREPIANEVAPGLWLGRRCSARELPEGISLVVDFTAEFSEPVSVRAGRTYLCVPTLDNAAPNLAQLERAVQAVIDHAGPVYVHCALGHGRSALLAIAVLQRTDLASSLADAEATVRAGRPGIKMNAVQRRMLAAWEQTSSEQTSS